VAGRALVVVGPDGTVEWSYSSPPLEVPGPELVFEALGLEVRRQGGPGRNDTYRDVSSRTPP
jgi:hypothetical protein